MVSRKDEARSFLNEVKAQFKAGNLMLYERAVKNLETYFEVSVHDKSKASGNGAQGSECRDNAVEITDCEKSEATKKMEKSWKLDL